MIKKMESKKAESKPKEVSLTAKNQETIKNIIAQKQQLDRLLQDVTTVILDTLNVDYKDRQVRFNQEITKIIIE